MVMFLPTPILNILCNPCELACLEVAGKWKRVQLGSIPGCVESWDCEHRLHRKE